jgi:hypothetical protein
MTKYSVIFVWLICSLYLPFSHAKGLEPASIVYTLDLDSNLLGSARLGRMETVLTREGSVYSASATTKAQGIAAILMGSSLNLNCDFSIDNNRAIGISLDVGRKKDKKYQARYNWSNRKIEFKTGESLDMPQGYIIDDCNMPFVATLLKGKGLNDQTLYVLDAKKQRLRGYKHISTEPESIETPIGNKDTLKVVLEREFRPGRTFTLWLSPENNYLPIKMEEKRKSRTTILLVEEIKS